MNVKKLKSQSGRSMVEMLGVLALIGVLSVGGIAGYSLSMRRHRANGIVDTASKYALVAYNQCQQQVLNGEADDVSYCHNNLTFENAGIGNLPAGVEFGGSNSTPYISHDIDKGVDTVGFSAEFDDDKLCQAVASITGSTCNDGHVFIEIKQN